MANDALIAAYHRLPYALKVVSASGTALFKIRKKYGRYFHEYFNFLMSYGIRDQEARAQEELSAFLKHVRQKSVFYGPYLLDATDLGALPIIDKSTVLQNYVRIQLQAPFFTGKSSGTSGQPLEVPYSENVYQKEYAFWWYHRSFAAVKRGDRVATIAGHKIADVRRDKPPFWVYNAAERQLFFSSYHLSQRNLPHYISRLNAYKPEFVHGYPSSLYLIARYILDNGILIDFQPKMVVCSSETTLDFQRTVIEKAFGCKAYIWYGNTELCGHITECPNGRLHVQPYHSYVRILKEDNSDAGLGETGRLVATNFSNYVFPLINYDMKDLVRVSAEQACSCGKGGLILDHIIGRIEDYIVTPEGVLVGRLDHLFKSAKHVRNAQIVQDDVGRIKIRIEKEDGYTKIIEGTIQSEARRRLGKSIEIEFDYVREIEKEANGKCRFIVQKIKEIRAGNIRFN